MVEVNNKNWFLVAKARPRVVLEEPVALQCFENLFFDKRMLKNS